MFASGLEKRSQAGRRRGFLNGGIAPFRATGWVWAAVRVSGVRLVRLSVGALRQGLPSWYRLGAGLRKTEIFLFPTE